MAYTTEERREIIDAIIERLMDGESLRKICASDDMPSKSTVLKWMNEDDEQQEDFRTIIARAREMQADALDDDIADITQRMLDGELGHNEAKTAIWAMQWRASKMRPRKYGDRLDLGNADSKPFLIEIVK